MDLWSCWKSGVGLLKDIDHIIIWPNKLKYWRLVWENGILTLLVDWKRRNQIFVDNAESGHILENRELTDSEMVPNTELEMELEETAKCEEIS